jgi:uncharacterized protein (DUF2336 family)
MIIGSFLLWARTAPAGQRAEAASALARAFLYSDLSDQDRWQAETALIALLDDVPNVRRALAEAFANAVEAPRPIITALANDQPDIAVLVLARSPVLPDSDLVDCAALGDDFIQTAIASRPMVSLPVAAALAEIASPEVLVTLLENAGARISASSFSRMVERHGWEGPLREVLLARPDLPLTVRQEIAVSLSESLSDFVVGCGWLTRERGDRVAREAREKTTVALATAADDGDVYNLVKHLRVTAQLTPALILRAILSCRFAFAEAALADLSGLSLARVAGLIHDPSGSGFAALCRRAGLPETLRPAFEAALAAWRECTGANLAPEGARVSRRMVERALTACDQLPEHEAGVLASLLRRFEMEAARDEAREYAETLAQEAALASALPGTGLVVTGAFGRDHLATAA